MIIVPDRCQNLDKFASAKVEFDRMYTIVIIQCLASPWATPLQIVQIVSGEWHPCGVYKSLNDMTISNQYPIFQIHDFSAHQAGVHIFSKINSV